MANGPSTVEPDTQRVENLLAQARAARGFMPEDEGRALHEAAHLAAAGGDEPLIEIGAYCGKSTLYLAAAVLRAEAVTGRRPVLFSLDHHRGSEENQSGWEHHDPTLVDTRTGLMDTLSVWRRTVHDAGAEDLVVGLVGDSARVAACWKNPMRFVFVDGGHGADPAWADYRGWAPKVVEGGLLAIHDVFPDPADGGRPPYQIYRRALDCGAFAELEGAGRGSLRVLRRVAPGI